jgi:hypothetical protein
MSIHDAKFGGSGNNKFSVTNQKAKAKRNTSFYPQRLSVRVANVPEPIVAEDGIEQQIEDGGDVPEEVLVIPHIPERQNVKTIEDQGKPKEMAEKLVPKPHSLNGKMLHIKVGDPSWRDMDMLDGEITKVEEQVIGLLESNNIDCAVLVTHWAVEVKVVEG